MYTRRQVTDHVTKMNKDLYDNLQDGIDEAKSDIEEMSSDLSELKLDVDSTSGVVSSSDDAFSEDKEYKVGDIVIQNNTLYKCILPVETPGQWIQECWKKTTLLEQLGLETKNIKYSTNMVFNKAITPTIKNKKATITFEKDVIIRIIAEVFSAVGNTPSVTFHYITGSTYPVTSANVGVYSIISYLPVRAGTYTISTNGTDIKNIQVYILSETE